jgi:hypothetical protein
LQADHGEMAEWSNAAVLKTVRPARVSWVRIPVSPPLTYLKLCVAIEALLAFQMEQLYPKLDKLLDADGQPCDAARQLPDWIFDGSDPETVTAEQIGLEMKPDEYKDRVLEILFGSDAQKFLTVLRQNFDHLMTLFTLDEPEWEFYQEPGSLSTRTYAEWATQNGVTLPDFTDFLSRFDLEALMCASSFTEPIPLLISDDLAGRKAMRLDTLRCHQAECLQLYFPNKTFNDQRTYFADGGDGFTDNGFHDYRYSLDVLSPVIVNLLPTRKSLDTNRQWVFEEDDSSRGTVLEAITERIARNDAVPWRAGMDAHRLLMTGMWLVAAKRFEEDKWRLNELILDDELAYIRHVWDRRLRRRREANSGDSGGSHVLVANNVFSSLWSINLILSPSSQRRSYRLISSVEGRSIDGKGSDLLKSALGKNRGWLRHYRS